MKEFFKRDNLWLGMGIGVVIPIIFYFLIQLITILVSKDGDLFRKSTDQLLAICANLIPFRYYLVKLKADKTGRGIFVVTFIMAMLYFYFNFQS